MSIDEESQQEFQPLIDELERTYPVQVSVRQSHWGAFTGGGGEIALVAFVFGAVAGGFLSAVGEDLWAKAKALCKRIHDRHKTSQHDSESTIVAVFEYKGFQITAHLKLDKRNRQELEAVYRGDPLAYFWEGIPIQLGEVIRLIDEGQPYVRPAKALGLTLDNRKPAWTVTRYVEATDVEELIFPRNKGKPKKRPR